MENNTKQLLVDYYNCVKKLREMDNFLDNIKNETLEDINKNPHNISNIRKKMIKKIELLKNDEKTKTTYNDLNLRKKEIEKIISEIHDFDNNDIELKYNCKINDLIKKYSYENDNDEYSAFETKLRVLTNI